MLKEAFEYLAKLGRDTVPDVVKAEAEPQHVYYLRNTDGSLTRTVAEAKPVAHQADNLNTIADIANEGEGAAVWVRPFAVTVTFATRSSAKLELKSSDALAQLTEWAKHKPQLAQAALIAALRTTFAGTLGQHPDLLAVLRKVRFNLNQSTVGEVSHGKASLGKTIEGEVYGTAAIPETITLNIPVYVHPFLGAVRVDVVCAMDPDAATGQFRVIPLPGQIEAACEIGAQAIAGILRENLTAEIPVYFGAP